MQLFRALVGFDGWHVCLGGGLAALSGVFLLPLAGLFCWSRRLGAGLGCFSALFTRPRCFRLGCVCRFGRAVAAVVAVGAGRVTCLCLSGLACALWGVCRFVLRLSYGEVTDMGRSSCPGFASA